MIDDRLTGTIVNYYYHCKRQCWLFYNRINLEDNSEEVRIGRILHELKTEKEELSIDNIRLDKISKDYVTEIKKSDADINAALQQLYFYLIKLREKGIIRKGKLECIEKKHAESKTLYIELNDNMAVNLVHEYENIIALITDSNAPKPIFKKGCKKCAYYEYCLI